VRYWIRHIFAGKRELTEDYGLGSLSNFIDVERYNSGHLSDSTRRRKYKEGYQATGGIQERREDLTSQTLKTFFQPVVKRGPPDEESSSERAQTRPEDRTRGNVIKSDTTRKRFKDDDSSAGSDHDDIIERLWSDKGSR